MAIHCLDTIAVLTLACQHVNSQGMAARVDHVQSVEDDLLYLEKVSLVPFWLAWPWTKRHPNAAGGTCGQWNQRE